jgi:uncharacterized membrane protein YccC
LRITVAALLTFALGRLFGLQQFYWAVLSAVIVLQASVGGSLKATLDRVIGTLAGAVWAVVVSPALAYSESGSLGIALVLTVAPLAILAGFQPAYRVAPVTGIIVLLSSVGQQDGTVGTAVHRVLDIGFGGLVALTVAMFVVPVRAHELLARAASGALDLMGQQIEILSETFAAGADRETLGRLSAQIRVAMAGMETVAEETRRERFHRLTQAQDPEPLVRAIGRLHHHLEFLSRATAEPLPELVRSRLAEPVARVLAESAAFLRAAATALAEGTPRPALEGVVQALAAYASTMSDLRIEGVMRQLPGEAVGRIFGLSFGLDELRQDLENFAEHVATLHPGRNGPVSNNELLCAHDIDRLKLPMKAIHLAQILNGGSP